MIALILIPIAFVIVRCFRETYILSPLITLSCAAIAAPFAPILAAALVVSAVSDWFMAHKGDNQVMYLIGIAGFFLAHVIFIAHSFLLALGIIHEALILGRTVQAIPYRSALILGCVLLAGFLPYLLLRVIRKVPKLLKAPVVLYTLISIAGVTCAFWTGNPIYFLGIAALLFSDTMIAESDFAGNKAAGAFILPTYYLCHILVTMSALIH